MGFASERSRENRSPVTDPSVILVDLHLLAKASDPIQGDNSGRRRPSHENPGLFFSTKRREIPRKSSSITGSGSKNLARPRSEDDQRCEIKEDANYISRRTREENSRKGTMTRDMIEAWMTMAAPQSSIFRAHEASNLSSSFRRHGAVATGDDSSPPFSRPPAQRSIPRPAGRSVAAEYRPVRRTRLPVPRRSHPTDAQPARLAIALDQTKQPVIVTKHPPSRTTATQARWSDDRGTTNHHSRLFAWAGVQDDRNNSSSVVTMATRVLSVTSGTKDTLGSNMSNGKIASKSSSNIDRDCTTNGRHPKNNTAATAEPTKWRSAVDPNSGKTYYYHIETRETQWRKPTELATEEERTQMQEKERRQREFFAAMEQNILKSISQGVYSSGGSAPSSPKPRGDDGNLPGQQKQQQHQRRQQRREENGAHTKQGVKTGSIARPNLIRTISAMDESVLRDLVKRVPSHRNLFVEPNEVSVSPNDVASCGQDRKVLPCGGGGGGVDPLLVTSDNKATEQRRRQQEEETFDRLLRDNNNHRRMSQDKVGLVSIQEALQESAGSGLVLDDKDATASMRLLPEEEEEFPFSRENLVPERLNSLSSVASMGGLLLGLPDEDGEDPARRSFYGSSALDKSSFNFGLTEDETEALRTLAKISDEMAHAEKRADLEELDFLTGIAESDEDDNEEERLGQQQQDDDFTRFECPNGHLTECVANPLMLRDPGTSHLPEGRGDSPDGALGRPAVLRTGSDRKMVKTEPMAKPPMIRRNTCSTLYVGSTLSAPDKEAYIKCVCGVYRAHILQSEREGAEDTGGRYRIFNDVETQRKPLKEDLFRPRVDFVVREPPPSLDEITRFYRDVFLRAQMELDCIIMSLIYVERLIKLSNGALRPRTSNWRSILFSCLVLSSKVWDDLSMWNADFSETCPSGAKFPLQRINELELAVLSALGYKVKVPASEYAKYYFLLRSMLIKSGLGGDDLKTMNPLDVEGAKRLQQISGRYQTAAELTGQKQAAMLRSKSVGVIDQSQGKGGSADEGKGKVSLERVVQM